MKKRYTKLTSLVLVLFALAGNNVSAESITNGKYELNINELNQVTQIKEFKDIEHSDLIKDYSINNIDYAESWYGNSF